VVSTAAINWDTEAKMLGADPTATLALDRSAWERLGAIFTEVDDGDGETPGLATATVQVAGVPVQFGVLYYSGGDSTYLLLPGTDPERLSTIALLETLQAARALRIETDLLDLANGKPPLTLEDRVAELERQLAETQSELTARRRRPTKRPGKRPVRKAAAKTSRSSMQGT
jgi:hypothetical protein